MRLAIVALAVASCCPTRAAPVAAPPAAPVAAPVAPVAPVAAPDAGVAAPAPRWLKGTTHVHAAPSGDSSTAIPDVIAWYRANGYDFIALTDHNQISEVGAGSTSGAAAVWDDGLIVLAGTELTYNPDVCDPPPEPQHATRCRIHVSVLGPTARPPGRIEWAVRDDPARLAQYAKAVALAAGWGAPLVQLNHPRWFWGVDGALLAAAAQAGVRLVEINNKQFTEWNAGDASHAGAEAIWDHALTAGATVWGVASDDAHDYDTPGQYPAGGSYVMVWAPATAAGILDALAAGRFYGSTGVTLARVEVEAGELVVAVADDSPGAHRVTFIGDGKVLAAVEGRTARHPLAAASYVRAVVTRGDGARAWVQPARAAPP